MFTRRDFLRSSLQGSALVAVGAAAPRFLTSTALAAGEDRKPLQNILVVVELGGGNDGLNTVVPYADDLYHKARPTLRYEADDLLKLDDHVGLNPGLLGFEDLLDSNNLAVIQGVGYPNPNRSHFESMDIWQSADPRRRTKSGWLGRSVSLLDVREGRIPAFHVSTAQLPLALEGSGFAVPSMHPDQPFELKLGGTSYGLGDDASRFIPGEEFSVEESADDAYGSASPTRADARRKLIDELTSNSSGPSNSMLDFVQRTSLRTYTTVDRLREIVQGDFEKPEGEFERINGQFQMVREGLSYELQLIARMIEADFGTRIYYVSLDGFDTHSDQRQEHESLLAQLSGAVSSFFSRLDDYGHSQRVLLLTFSEFGRRVHENSSKGTDHGSGSCMFAAGPAVKGGLIGKHPSLEPGELASGDLKFHTDFRRVYATVLDRWLGCDSQRVLGGEFPHLELLA